MDVKRWTKREREIYKEAQAMLTEGTNAPAFSQRFFSQGGRLSELGPDEAARRRVVASELYAWLRQQFEELRRQEAEAFERETRALSGRLTITVPKSLHAALKREAMAEGVSLSELIRLKLGVSYRTATHMLAGVLPRASSG